MSRQLLNCPIVHTHVKYLKVIFLKTRHLLEVLLMYSRLQVLPYNGSMRIVLWNTNTDSDVFQASRNYFSYKYNLGLWSGWN